MINNTDTSLKIITKNQNKQVTVKDFGCGELAIIVLNPAMSS